jgi:protein-S-isoprenylcysteine O-methyltransferase Ste14
MSKDSPGVIAPPPLIYAAGLLLGAGLEWLVPTGLSSGLFLRVAGALFVLAGIGLIILPWLQMRKAKTNVEPWKPTKAIVTDGVYAYTRNPIYLGMIFIYLGVCGFFALVWPLPLLIIVLLLTRYGVIVREEKYLTEKFGAEYTDYCARTRRWF